MAFDLYQAITDRIIKELETGVIPWCKPWISGTQGAISYETGKPYSLLNQMMLGRPGEYLTFAQIQKQGGKVKRGEKAQMVVFWKWIEKESAENPEEVETFPILKYFNVFHIDQTEGVKSRHSKPLPDTAAVDQTADAIIADYLTRSGVTMKHETSDRAYYQPSTDSVTLPIMAQFKNTAEYYSTAFHELTHRPRKPLKPYQPRRLFRFFRVQPRRADRRNRSLRTCQSLRAGNAGMLPKQRRICAIMAEGSAGR